MKSVSHSANNDLSPGLPTTEQPWPADEPPSIMGDSDQDDLPQAMVNEYTKPKQWFWSGRTVYFFCDIHADTDAFLLSLQASGGIEKYGPQDQDFDLTEIGQTALFIIGGDCFDKGPENLRLLEAIHQLYLKGAEIELLAGNHDLRTYLGIYYAESKDPLLDHLFVRMGKKTVPLLKEIYERYPCDQNDQQAPVDEEMIRSRLYPSASWYKDFPEAAKPWMSEVKLERELRRIGEKATEFESRLVDVGLDLGKVHGAVKKFRELFFEPAGRYYWFFNKMKLAHREGSYLFVHAGVDDTTAAIIAEQDVDALNQQFRETLPIDPFSVYYGPLGNIFRTKYRDVDYPFGEQGVKSLHRAGIFAIVHGHRNILRGQRLCIRQGMLNFECDVSVDRNTRTAEGLKGPGAGVVVFTAAGQVKATSMDYPSIKVFQPDQIVIAS